jgi:hypothetical protein
MFIFVIQTLQKKWNEIYMKQLADGKHMENDCFPRTLKFEMHYPTQERVTLIAKQVRSHLFLIPAVSAHEATMPNLLPQPRATEDALVINKPR